MLVLGTIVWLYTLSGGPLDPPAGGFPRSAGALYDLYAPRAKRLAPVGSFDRARIVVQNRRIEHGLNGVQVVEATASGARPRGRIALQEHGTGVGYRNLKIRELRDEGP